jgi:hypothetical protein
MSGPIQITRRGLLIRDSDEQVQRLREQFSRQHYARLPEFLDTETLAFVRQEIDRGEFYERVHSGIKSNKELCLKQDAAYGALLLFVNDEHLFEIIRTITDCGRIGCFEGRVYRFAPRQGHHDAWHSDMAEDRLVALSVNLSAEIYTGGTLQIRDSQSHAIIQEVPNVGAGDALIFRVSANLQHRITKVTGTASKTAFAGWFRAKPDFLTLLKTTTHSDSSLNSPVG